MTITRKQRIGIFLSAIWFAGVATALTVNGYEEMILFVGGIPPLFLWGIWWIKQAKG